jgi:hypothetical protein
MEKRVPADSQKQIPFNDQKTVIIVSAAKTQTAVHHQNAEEEQQTGYCR